MGYFFGRCFLGSLYALIAEKGLPCCTQLREPLIHSLLISIIFDNFDSMKLIHALLRHSFIIVLLLRPQVDKIDVHFCLSCTVFIHCIIRCLSFCEDATTIISFFASIRDGIKEIRVDFLIFTNLYRTKGTLVC